VQACSTDTVGLTFLRLPAILPHSAQVMKRRPAPLALLILAAACFTSRTAANQQSSTALQQACGGLGQQCCPRCPPGTPAAGRQSLQAALCWRDCLTAGTTTDTARAMEHAVQALAVGKNTTPVHVTGFKCPQ
jgi:hypothetical protein